MGYGIDTNAQKGCVVLLLNSTRFDLNTHVADMGVVYGHEIDSFRPQRYARRFDTLGNLHSTMRDLLRAHGHKTYSIRTTHTLGGVNWMPEEEDPVGILLFWGDKEYGPFDDRKKGCFINGVVFTIEGEV